jgi:hypothetical protein
LEHEKIGGTFDLSEQPWALCVSLFVVQRKGDEMKQSAIGAFLVAALAGTAAAGQISDRTTLDTILGVNQILEDFESFEISAANAVGLDVFTLDNTNTANGQGPGLVEPGANYLDPSQIGLQWNGDNYFGINSKTLMAAGNAGMMTITYSTAVTAMGIDLRAFSGFGYSGTVTVFDTSGAVISTTNISLASGGPESVFFGWENAAGIGSVEIHSSSYTWSPIIDNHGYGAVPTPGTASLLLIGGLLSTRRRR